MQAGKMDRRVTLRRRAVASADTNRSKAVTYVAYATVSAEKSDLSARELVQASTTEAEIASRFRIRYRSDVAATDRLTCEGRDYEVIAPPQEVGRREYQWLLTRVVANAAV